MSEQGRAEKEFTPDQLVIDGTERVVDSEKDPTGNRRHYEIQITKRRLSILLPLRLFSLLGTLALMRDLLSDQSFITDSNRGFVHRDQLGVKIHLINQYVYATRDSIRRQLHQALWRDEISRDEFDTLVRWPVFEPGFKLKLWNHWRCAIKPDAVFLTDKVLKFANANLVRAAIEHYNRRGVFLTDQLQIPTKS